MYIYIHTHSEKESKYFDLEISVVYEILGHFGRKIHRVFNYITSSLPNCSSILNIYYSQKELTHICLEVSTYFGLGLLGHFGPKKLYKKN